MIYPRLLVASLSVLLLLTILPLTFSTSDTFFDQEDYIGAIEESVSKLGEDRFQGDSTLTQTLDASTGETSYRVGKNGPIVFSRLSNDAGRGVIVLREDEDKLKGKGKDKHVFIALRKKLDDHQVYYPLYAYVIPSKDCTGANPKGSFKLEFDIWDGGRTGQVYSRRRTVVGWKSCVETIFVPCKASPGDKHVKFWADPTRRVTNSTKPKVDNTKSSNVKTPKWGLNLILTRRENNLTFVPSSQGQSSWKIPSSSNPAATVAGGDFTTTLDFFADLIPSVKKARAAISSIFSDATSRTNLNLDMEDTDADMFQRKGWRTEGGAVQGRGITVALPFESETFVGFGNCPYVKISELDLDKLVSTQDYTNFYLTALRNQCQEKHVNQINHLFHSGYLILQKDKTLTLPTDLPVMQQAKLTRQETIDFSKAFEFALFSQVFLAELRTPSPVPQLPDGRLISHSIFTMLRFILHTMDQARKSSNHLILLSRNVINTILSSKTKALQDYEQISACLPCMPVEKEKSFAEILTFESAKRFLSSTHPMQILCESFDPFDNFITFYTQNQHALINETKLLCDC